MIPRSDSSDFEISNMDETGIVLDHKPMKVLARSGTKSLHGRSSVNNEMITFIGAVNADGGKTPPEYFISL